MSCHVATRPGDVSHRGDRRDLPEQGLRADDLGRGCRTPSRWRLQVTQDASMSCQAADGVLRGTGCAAVRVRKIWRPV